jgi:hypothetical protein
VSDLNDSNVGIIPEGDIATQEPNLEIVEDKSLISLEESLSWADEVKNPGNLTKLTKENCVKVITGLREGMSYGEAAELIGATRETIWSWRKKYPQFSQLCDEAGEHGIDIVEGECRKRALAKSDLLMMFWLKAKRPNVYREGPTTQITNNVNHFNVLMKSIEDTKPTETIDQVKK